jgi:hypothetical protein
MILNVKRCLYTVDVFFLDFLRMKKLELPNPVIVFTVRLTGPAIVVIVTDRCDPFIDVYFVYDLNHLSFVLEMFCVLS